MNRDIRTTDRERCHEAALQMAYDMDEYIWWKQSETEEQKRVVKGCPGSQEMKDSYTKKAALHYARAQEIGNSILSGCEISELPEAV